MDNYFKEAEKKWGHTSAWKESIERTKNWTKEDYKLYADEQNKFMKAIALKMKFGAQSEVIQNDIDIIYKNLNTFYTPSLELFRNLGKMYVEDERFKSYYENFSHGLAEFMRDAIEIYCNGKLKDSN